MKHLVEFRDEGRPAAGRRRRDRRGVRRRPEGQVAGTSKGKGFQGTIKRHNFASGPKSHGSHNVRAPGSIGRVRLARPRDEGHPRPRQMGNKRITQKASRSSRSTRSRTVDAKQNLLLLRGAVPGPRNGVVEVRTDG